MDTLMKIRPFVPQDWDALVKGAEADNHAGVYAPTVVYEKEGEIVGYCSMAVPSVLSWQHTQKVKPMDSLRLLGFIEGSLATQPFIMIPCDPESPYNRLLPKAGYIQYTKPVNLYLKVR